MMKRQKGLLKFGIITMMDLLSLLRYVRFVSFDPKPSAKTFFGTCKRSNICYLLATLRLRWRLSRDGCQSALWDCFGGRICRHVENMSPKTVPQCTLTTISSRSPAQRLHRWIREQQDEANPVFWLATRAGKMGPSWPRARNFPRWSRKEK